MSLVGYDQFASGNFNAGQGILHWLTSDFSGGVSVQAGVGFGGGNGARFRYGPDAPGADSTAEARFQLTSPLWPTAIFAWRQFTPANYEHRLDAPTNNKLFALWYDDYNDANNEPHVVIELERDGLTESRVRIASARAEPCESEFPDQIQYTGPNLITAADRGVWNTYSVIIYAAYKSSAIYVIKNSTICAAIVPSMQYSITCPVWTGEGKESFNFGYLMGWSNSGFTQQTDFIIDDFVIYDALPETTVISQIKGIVSPTDCIDFNRIN